MREYADNGPFWRKDGSKYNFKHSNQIGEVAYVFSQWLTIFWDYTKVKYK